MIEYVETNIFKSDAQALVVPVNCKGAMGAGAAKAFKEHFPELEHQYKLYCKGGILKPGRIQYIPSGDNYPAFILIATKDHWKDPSKLEWIEQGVIQMASVIEQCNMKSVSMPQIGCGLGGLDWQEVKKIIERAFKNTKVTVRIHVFADKNKKRKTI